MSNAHTPGPWEFVDNSLVGPKIDDKPIWLRPVILRSEVGVRKSDAQLICAAPDLLEALEWLVDLLPDPELDNDELQRAWTKKARAAIAKATGAAA